MTTTNHLTDDVLMDALDGTPSSAAQGHVASCPECQDRLEEARAGLVLAEGAALPEPAPAFWPVFRAQVARDVDRVRRARRALTFAPAALAAAAAIAIIALPGPPAPVAPAVPLPAWSALPAAEDDPSLEVLESVVEVSSAELALAGCGDLAGCVSALSEEEARDLAEALRGELQKEAL